MRGTVKVRMQASPERVWSLVSDVTQIGSYSPETFEAEWLDGATGPAMGATFRGHVKRNGRGPTYWTTCKVVACDEPREFGFAVVFNDKPLNTWRYVIEPAGHDASDVTESYELSRSLFTRVYWALLGRARSRTNARDMRATLEAIRKVAEQRPSAPPG